MTESIYDPVFAAIEKHRLADAAYDASIDRGADETVKNDHQNQETAALIAMMRTKPSTFAGCLAALRYLADWAETNDAGLFHSWNDPYRSAGAAFLPMIADAIEAASPNKPR